MLLKGAWLLSSSWWQLSGVCLAAAWMLPGSCLATGWLLPGSCLAAAWQLLSCLHNHFDLWIWSRFWFVGLLLGLFWGRFWIILGALGGHFCIPEASWNASCLLVHPRRSPGPSQECLGEAPGPFRCRFWANLAWTRFFLTEKRFFSEGILGQNRHILEPTCLQKAFLSNVEVFSRSLEGSEAREPQFYPRNDRFLIKNCTNSTSKISKIRYYSSSKWIFDFFEEIPRKSRFWPHLRTQFWHFWGHLGSFWRLLEALGTHFWHLEANLEPTWGNMSQLDPT